MEILSISLFKFQQITHYFYIAIIKLIFLILTGNNVHTCSYCGRFFAHKHVYESHVRTHTGKEHNIYVGELLAKRF